MIAKVLRGLQPANGIESAQTKQAQWLKKNNASLDKLKIVDIDFSFEGGRAGGRALTSVNEKETRNNL